MLRVLYEDKVDKCWRIQSCIVTLTTILLAMLGLFFSLRIEFHEEFGRIDRRNVIAQIEKDWNAVPFVKISSFETGCPEGWDPVFERVWKGIEEGCHAIIYTNSTRT